MLFASILNNKILQFNCSESPYILHLKEEVFRLSLITRLKAVQRGTPLTLIIAFVASLMLANFDTSTNTIAIDYMPFTFILSWVISSALTPIFNLAD